MIGLPLLIVLLAFSTPTTQEDGDMSASACFSQPDKVLVANCTALEMIRISSLYYGYNPHGACNDSGATCMIQDTMYLPCVGQSRCHLNLPSGGIGRKLHNCDDHSNFMQVNYACVPDAEVRDICAHSLVTSQKGYISTPRYPNNYPASRNCTVVIRVHPSQTLRLYIIDLELEAVPGGGCKDWLYMAGAQRSNTYCGERSREETPNTLGNSLSLTFESDATGSNKGFWVYYEAFPLLPETTTVSTTITATTTLPTTTTPSAGVETRVTSPRPVASLSPAVRHDVTTSPAVNATQRPVLVTPVREDRRKQHLPVEGIIGGVLGSLLCILFILLILLILKRRKEREMSESQSTHQLHTKPPMSPLRGATGPYIQNDLNHCAV